MIINNENTTDLTDLYPTLPVSQSEVPELHQDLQVPVLNRTELRPSDKPDFK